MYLSKVKSLAKEFKSMAISQTPGHVVRYASSLAYLAVVLEVDSPRSLQLNIQETWSIEALSTRMSNMYISECSLTNLLP